MGKRPTIQMVADRAGVSRGTVDRVLNNRSYVREEVRQNVLEAIEQLGYLAPRAPYPATAFGAALPPLKLGVVLPNFTGHFREEVTRGIAAARTELSEFNITILTEECQTEVPREVIEKIDALLEAGVAGISLCALNDISVENKIDELADRSIPVITFNSDLPDSRRLCFIGQDYYRSGRIAGELMSKCVSPYTNVLATVGNLEFNGHRRRLEGFCARMNERGFATDRIEIAETYNDYSLTYKKVTAALEKTQHLAAVYMANLSVEGCVDAIRDAGRTGQVRVICHDVSKATRRLLKEGSVDLTISQDMFQQGRQPLILLRELLQKQRQPDPDFNSGSISIICTENLDL